MMWQDAERIADALLYEGYLLYPYRSSAVKNRYRWQFGVVAPREYGAAASGREPSRMQTQCLLEPGESTVVDVKVRFLQVEARQVEALADTADRWNAVDRLFVEGREHVTWDEAVPRELVLREVAVPAHPLSSVREFTFPGGRDVEVIQCGPGGVIGRVVRERWPISCTVQLAFEPADDLRRVTIVIENATTWPQGADADRPSALRRSLIGTHTLLAVRDGEFVSLLDPPPHAAAAVAGCENLHCWPVLVGREPQRGTMLSSPIILYDYPSVAPESPGDLFDGTEIDELLTLRLQTLTEEERRQALATDPLAGQVIERATSLPAEDLGRLHGAIRYLGEPMRTPADPSGLEEWLNPPAGDPQEAVDVAGRPVHKGSRVRLHPGGGADAMDMFLEARIATVAEVYRDLEDRVHVAVIVDAGDAADLHESNGRFFYFRPDEVEVLEPGAEPLSARAPAARVLVAGIGNMFLGDDAFGCAVVQRLAARELPEHVRVEDFGIRGIDLAYDLLEASYETAILVDAVSCGGAPGTLCVLEPNVEGTPIEPPNGHTLSVEAVLAFLKTIGGTPGKVLIVGCEPSSLTPEVGLSDVVAQAVDHAAELVLDLIGSRG